MSKQSATQTRPNAAQPSTSAYSSQVCIQRDAKGPGVEPGAVPLVQSVLNSPGRPLDVPLRDSMEQRFGRDFSGVRIHTDQAAAESTRALHANAYTAGSTIAFANGKYSPATGDGRKLIAHELTHVVQQSSGTVSRTPIGGGLAVSDPSDSFERAADAVANGSGSPLVPAPRYRSGATGDAITIQRAPIDQAPPTNPAPAAGTGSIMQQPQAPAGQQPGLTAAQAPSAFPTTPLPYEKWQAIEARVTPELGIDFLEIGRVAAVDVKQQLYAFFQPYDDSIVDANQKFGSYLNIALAGAGNVPSDPKSNASFSITGGIGGAISQVGQVVVGNILDTGAVAVAKQRANLDADTLVADKLTTDSPIYDDFEQSALISVRKKADHDWRELQEKFPPELNPEMPPSKYARDARSDFGPHSSRVQSVISQFKKLLDPYLAKLKGRLDALQEKAKQSRRTAGLIGGLIAGGIIGGAVGVGVGASIGGGTGLFAGLVIAGMGAGLGAIAGRVGADIFNAAKSKPEEKPKTEDEKAKADEKDAQKRADDRAKLQTIPEEDDDDKEEKKEGGK